MKVREGLVRGLPAIVMVGILLTYGHLPSSMMDARSEIAKPLTPERHRAVPGEAPPAPDQAVTAPEELALQSPEPTQLSLPSSTPRPEPSPRPSPNPSPESGEWMVPPIDSIRFYRSEPTDPRVKLTLNLDKTTFRTGEKIIGELVVENKSVEFINIDHKDLCEFDKGLYDRSGTWVGGHDHFRCFKAEKQDSLKPLEVRRYPIDLDLNKKRTYEDESRSPLPPGSYQAVAGIFVDRIQRTWFAPGVIISIVA